MICKIAVIVVEMDVKYEPLLSQAKAYEVTDYDKVDIVLTPTEKAFQEFRSAYPAFSVGNAEYMLYGVEGSALGGHTKEKAKELLMNDLKKVFFDNETKLKNVTNFYTLLTPPYDYQKIVLVEFLCVKGLSAPNSHLRKRFIYESFSNITSYYRKLFT